MTKLSTQNREALALAIAALDDEAFERNPGGFMRPPFPGEAEFYGRNKVLGVVFEKLKKGHFGRFPFSSWVELERICAAIGISSYEPGDVADCLGCTLIDLGVMRGVE